MQKPQEFIKCIEDNMDVHSTNPPAMPPTMGPIRPRSTSTFLPPTVVTLERSSTSKNNECSSVAVVETRTQNVGDSESFSKLPHTRGQTTLRTSEAQIPPMPVNVSTESQCSGNKSKVVSDATPTVKQFIPYTGVKNNPVPYNSKTVTHAPRPVKQGLVRHCYSDGHYTMSTSNPRSGNFVSKCFTPVTRPVNELRDGAGSHQNGTGRFAMITRSNLFGTSTESGDAVANSSAKPVSSNTPTDAHNSNFNALDSTPNSRSSQLDEKRKDIARRTRLLGRIPSPPPLSPLPSPMPQALRRSYRVPSRGMQSPQSGEGEGDTISPSASKLGQSSGRCENDTTGISSIVKGKVTAKEDSGILSIDGLTASQREVQELMGMSLSCLDMEWSQQTPVKNDLTGATDQISSHQGMSESPPMDLSYSEKEIYVEQTHGHDKLQHSRPEMCNVNNTNSSFGENSKTSQNTTNKLINQAAAEQQTSEMNNKTVPQSEVSEITKSSPPSPNNKNPVSKKHAPTAKERLRVAKRPANKSPSNQQRPKQGKRFCTRGDLAVIDFDSLHGDEGMSNKRVTRSSKRKQKN